MKTRTAIIIGAILLAAVSRTIPHPWNFSPVAAMALFGAALLPNKRLGLVLPLLAVLVSDVCIEVQYLLGLSPNWGFYPSMAWNYLAYALIGLIGLLLRRLRNLPRVAEGGMADSLLFFLGVAGASLASSVLFFGLTNFGTWAFRIGMTVDGPPYPLTLPGLVECFSLALPFFRSTLQGDAIYCAIFFGGFALAEMCLPVLQRPVAPATMQPAQG